MIRRTLITYLYQDRQIAFYAAVGQQVCALPVLLWMLHQLAVSSLQAQAILSLNVAFQYSEIKRAYIWHHVCFSDTCSVVPLITLLEVQGIVRDQHCEKERSTVLHMLLAPLLLNTKLPAIGNTYHYFQQVMVE